MLEFSILIPTYNRKAKLQKVLEALRQQKRIEKGEVIVGIDGSTDGTEEWLEKEYKDYKDLKISKDSKDSKDFLRLSWFRIENSGRAVIRNRLLDRAKGKIVLFIQDDIVVTDGWLEAHLEAQRNRTGAVVGHMTWYPEVQVTPYMRWLEQGGHLLDFAGLKDGDELDFWHFYMGNISIPREFLNALRFDESVPTYGWEDILFGYEFVRAGGKVYYSSSALAYHWDEYREEDLCHYMQKVGTSAVWAEEKYPGLGFVPPWWKKGLFHLMIGAGKIAWPFLSQKRRWYLQMKQWFLESCRGETERRKEKKSFQTA